ncbi:MAG: cytochrome b5-like heme/steroid binding domain-containing protein [Candidatus Pacebacteria bacterium]|nr:cytochrome b5-like heme/steroid binding domain-containing protein [Candidatus Paceibacterota bacterium]
MNSKIILGIIVVLLLVGGIFLFSSQTATSPSPSPTLTGSTETPVPSESPSGSPVSSGSREYSLADVAAHANAQSCYTTINAKVYDLTSWIDQHPGGREAILSLCGKDGTAAFTAMHGGQARPEAELASLFIGVLK